MAYMWLHLAAAANDHPALRDSTHKLAGAVAGMLTRRQRARALSLARGWRPNREFSLARQPPVRQ
jgi:hypothetical protein